MPDSKKKKKYYDKFTKEMNNFRKDEFSSVISRLPKDESRRHLPNDPLMTPDTPSVAFTSNDKNEYLQSGYAGSLKKKQQADIKEPQRTGIKDDRKKGSFDYYAQSQPVKNKMEQDKKKKAVKRSKDTLKFALTRENERKNKIREINQSTDSKPKGFIASKMWALIKGGK